MSPLNALLLFLSGVAAGFINMNAGGGSFLTLPLLMILGGLPAAVANGTNRIAILAQNLVGIKRFRRSGFRDARLGLKLAASAIVGSIIGSMIAQDIPEETFRIVFSVLMVLALVVVLRPRRAECDTIDAKLRHPALQAVIFFFIGIYGGLIQAGTGFLIIFTLCMLGGLPLVRTNSLKIVIIAAYMVPSLIIFIANGNVSLLPALILTAGTSLGGWLGAGFALKKGDFWIRVILLISVLGLAGKMLRLY